MKLCIIGAGALGSLLGFCLSPQAEVWLLDGWEAHVAAIHADGLQCVSDDGVEVRRVRATSDPAAIGACDVALVLVKSHQTRWAAELLLKEKGTKQKEEGRTQKEEATDDQPPAFILRPSPFILTLQNGLGNRETLAAALGAQRVGQGVTALGATLLGPGRVRWAGRGATVFGTSPDRATVERLAALFEACGLPASLSDDLDALVWGKLLVNAGINALTALLRVPNGALAEVPEARALLEQAVREAAAVARARGVQLPYADPVAHVLSVAQATAHNRSSMLQDVLRGSPTEIAVINGALVREGQRLGVPTPVNRMLTALVQALDATALHRV